MLLQNLGDEQQVSLGESTRRFGLQGRIENSRNLAPSEYKARLA